MFAVGGIFLISSNMFATRTFADFVADRDVYSDSTNKPGQLLAAHRTVESSRQIQKR